MKDKDILIGVDAGTTNVKAVAFNGAGREVATCKRENTVRRPAPGHVEQDMEATWATTAETIQEVVSTLPPQARVSGVGITGQGDGLWAITEEGKPARNAILWSDSRAAGILEEWEADGRLESIIADCGSPLYPGMSLPLLAWLEREEPGTFEAVDTILSCKDWLKYRLTGERTTDPSEATVPYLDRTTEAYNPDIFELVGLSETEAILPALVPGCEVAGTVTQAAADATGLPTGTPVVSGLIDVAASAIGSGAVAPGESAISLGTSFIVQEVTDGPRPETSGIQMSLGTGGFWTYAIGSNAGTPSLDWLADLVDVDGFDEFEALASSVPVGSDGLLYHPYLSTSGERGPFTDPDARAQFVGLTPEHTTDHLVRAVYEGLSLTVRDCVEHLPDTVTTVSLSGGGARSEFWCQLLADCLDATIVVPAGTEFGAKGAAILLGLAMDEYPDLASAVDRTVTTDRRYEPRTDVAEKYDALYDLFLDIRQRMGAIWSNRARTYQQLAGESS